MNRIGETIYTCNGIHHNIVYLSMDDAGRTYSGSNMDYCSECNEPTTDALCTNLTIDILGQALAQGFITPEAHDRRVARLQHEGVPDWDERMEQGVRTGGLANRIE